MLCRGDREVVFLHGFPDGSKALNYGTTGVDSLDFDQEVTGTNGRVGSRESRSSVTSSRSLFPYM